MTTRERFAAARVARLATASPDGVPHVVPVCFAVDGDVIYSAVDDAKPKSGRPLRRLANIASNPRVSLLADEWSEDWARLWWARVDGRARVVERDDRAIALLCEKYPQYAAAPPPGPVVVVEVSRWVGWP